MSKEVRIEIAPADWLPAVSQWDKAGPFFDERPLTDQGATHTHAWAANHGCYAYAFSWPQGSWVTVELTARLSSEHPWYSSPANHFSDVTLLLNGHAYPSRRVIPDDGSGRVYRWSINPQHLIAGENEIAFAVRRNSLYRNGLCIYHRALVHGETDCPIALSAKAAPSGS
jgi:hypothetical protein